MANTKNWNDSLDDLLEKLSNGDFVDQSINEFEKTVNQTTASYTDQSAAAKTKRSYKTASYRTVLPHVNRTKESMNYPSRYLQVITCLENIVYDSYPEGKKAGYQAAISRYIEEVKANSANLKPVEAEVEADMKEYKEKVNSSNTDEYLQGYYDALLQIKKLIYNSKLSRLQVLTNKVSK